MDKLDYYKIEDYAKTHMTDITHDMHHVYRVLNVALDIAEHEANVDMDVLTAACLLHDIGRNAQAADPKLCHAEVGGEMAHDFLLTLGWTKEKAFCVKKCVQSHRFRGDNKPQSIEAKILFDADKVDVCGVIGIARGFTYIGENNSGVIYKTDESGAVLTDEPETFFGEYNYKLRNIYDKFHTQRGKEIAGIRWKNSLDFYDALLSEVKQST
ncbi:MAG: HD domain-containing protein, partial [Defluviitaleaceae bacterium]|nr:HD domain-containing protein [Defluviitaleaceae bacterium]